jgi:transcriptional regulator with XRE-family HTH domain
VQEERKNNMKNTKKSSSKFPTNLRRLRELAGASQYEVAREISIDRSRLSEIESGHVVPRPEQLAGILRAIRAAHAKQQSEFEQLVAGAEAA